eukprot:1847117-Alexandrium_andersonii.AAC.1
MRDVKVLKKAEHLWARIFDAYGPKDRILDKQMQDVYVWAMKKGAEYVNITPQGMGLEMGVVSERSYSTVALI